MITQNLAPTLHPPCTRLAGGLRTLHTLKKKAVNYRNYSPFPLPKVTPPSHRRFLARGHFRATNLSNFYNLLIRSYLIFNVEVLEGGFSKKEESALLLRLLWRPELFNFTCIISGYIVSKFLLSLKTFFTMMYFGISNTRNIVIKNEQHFSRSYVGPFSSPYFYIKNPFHFLLMIGLNNQPLNRNVFSAPQIFNLFSPKPQEVFA